MLAARWPPRFASPAHFQKGILHPYKQAEDPLATQRTLQGVAPSVAVPIGRVEGSRNSRADDVLAVEQALEIRDGTS